MQMIGEVAYAPSRDVVYLWPDVMRNLADRLEDAPFKPLADFLESEGISMEQLAQAYKAYIDFINAAHRSADKGVYESLEDAGWLQCPLPAQLAVMYYLGMMITGVAFRGLRDVVAEDGDTIPQVRLLMQEARLLDRYIAKSRWQRWLHRKYRSLQRWLGRDTTRATKLSRR